MYTDDMTHPIVCLRKTSIQKWCSPSNPEISLPRHWGHTLRHSLLRARQIPTSFHAKLVIILRGFHEKRSRRALKWTFSNPKNIVGGTSDRISCPGRIVTYYLPSWPTFPQFRLGSLFCVSTSYFFLLACKLYGFSTSDKSEWPRFLRGAANLEESVQNAQS